MEDPNALLDKFTQLLAYAGDAGAKDGYFLHYNNEKPIYSIPIRDEPLSEETLVALVKKIKKFIKNNKPINGVPPDIIIKITELKDLYDATKATSSKKELIQYIGDYVANSGMHGGTRKKIRQRSKKTRRS
jgi:hypothetical protein